MHPNPAFRNEDRQLQEMLIDQVGFGMVFAQAPDGPRVAHTPLLSTGDGMIRFHLSRANALTRHLDGMTTLILVNGPDAYVSPRWYEEPNQVPTWNYLALELEGRVRPMNPDELRAFLEALTTRQEGRIAEGRPWTIDKMDAAVFDKMHKGIVGFEMEVLAWRPSFKLSQNKPPEERVRVADALERNGSRAIAQLMRTLAE
jgi:transcriptional regulator